MAKVRPASLSLTMPNPLPASDHIAHSPSSSSTFHSGSPKSARRHDDHFFDANYNLGDKGGGGTVSQFANTLTSSKREPPPAESTSPTSPSFTSLPPFPTSPESAPKHVRDPSKSFFSNLKASKSSSKIQQVESTIRQVRQDSTEGNAIWRKKSQGFNQSKVSLPSPTVGSNESVASNGVNDAEKPLSGAPLSRPTTVNSTVESETSNETASTKSKAKLPSFLKRNGSVHLDQAGRKSKPSTPSDITIPDIKPNEARSPDGPLTAPIRQENSYNFQDFVKMAPRNHSIDRHQRMRQPSPNSDHGDYRSGRNNRSRDRSRGLNNSTSQVFRGDGSGSHFFSGIKNATTRTAEGLGKAGNRLMGRINNKSMVGSASANHIAVKDPPEDDRDYIHTVIKLPLVEQTRITRIAKRLENSKDKTEFWMPALPWRCIDYLNYKGCDEEGLYRVPGSGREIRNWQKRFDQEYDVNLFDQEDLYDINIIGSMFKAWLRDLPDEILPKETQERIHAACPDQSDAPQMLKDELSMLPPWNYYLLFAITCHLSLLHAYVEKNKMSYNNLLICFAPALRIQGDCFRWLVCDWRNCWQGCWTEKDNLEEEYRILDRLDIPTSHSGTTAFGEDRSISSAGSTSGVQGFASIATKTSTEHLGDNLLNKNHTGTTHGRSASQLPELQLLQPISPIFASHSHERN